MALIGTITPSDVDEAMGTLQLLARGMPAEQHPLVNDTLARGLLRQHYRHLQVLQERIAFAETRLERGMNQLESGQKHLPNQLATTTDRLQALVDSMQQEAAGKLAERQHLMAEVMALRTQLNTAVCSDRDEKPCDGRCRRPQDPHENAHARLYSAGWAERGSERGARQGEGGQNGNLARTAGDTAHWQPVSIAATRASLRARAAGMPAYGSHPRTPLRHS